MFQYSPPVDLLNNKTILITGAGAGIGRCAALTYAKYGATTILLGKTTSKLESLYDEMTALDYPEPYLHPIDFEVATEADYQLIVSAIQSQLPKLDGLLHNASILGELTPLSQYKSEYWNKVLQVNLTSQLQLTQALHPLLTAAPYASVIFTSSTVGHQPRAFWGAYSVSKAATEAVMKIFSDEEEELSNIRFNSINPGATRTKMRAQAFPAENPETLVSADSIMSIYLYLMGDDSIHESGQSFHAQKNNN